MSHNQVFGGGSVDVEVPPHLTANTAGKQQQNKTDDEDIQAGENSADSNSEAGVSGWRNFSWKRYDENQEEEDPFRSSVEERREYRNTSRQLQKLFAEGPPAETSPSAGSSQLVPQRQFLGMGIFSRRSSKAESSRTAYERVTPEQVKDSFTTLQDGRFPPEDVQTLQEHCRTLLAGFSTKIDDLRAWEATSEQFSNTKSTTPPDVRWTKKLKQFERELEPSAFIDGRNGLLGFMNSSPVLRKLSRTFSSLSLDSLRRGSLQSSVPEESDEHADPLSQSMTLEAPDRRNSVRSTTLTTVSTASTAPGSPRRDRGSCDKLLTQFEQDFNDLQKAVSEAQDSEVDINDLRVRA